MSVFFAGRKITSPAVASVVDDSGLTNKNLTVGNVLAVLGTSIGGEPNKPLRFGDPADAKAVLKGGLLLDAVLKAFDPSPETPSPSEVVAIRVNPAVRSALNLLDSGAATAIELASTDYGLRTNQIKVKVETGSVSGKKLTTQLGNDYYTADNVGRAALSVQYTGAEVTANVSVSNTQVTLQAPTGATVATIDLATYDTVQKLVDRINAVAGFVAAPVDGNAEAPTLRGLDTATAQDCRTAAYTVRADLQACVDWFNGNSENLITAKRATNAGLPPANVGFTYLAGGSDGNVTNTEWSNAFAALQNVDAQWVVPVTPNAAIHAMCDAHVHFMSSVGRKERRAVCGTDLGTTDAQALAAAKALNSDRTSLCHIGIYDYDSSGKLVLRPPYITAAAVGGAFAAVNPGTPLTNKAIKARGLERSLRNPTDTDPLIEGGVLCIEETATGYKVVQSISTWLVNDNYNRVEVSTGVAVDYTIRQVREKLDTLRGQKGSPLLLSRALSLTESTLKELARPEPQGPGILVGDEQNPAYRAISVSLEADVIRVQFECHPAIGVNYVLVSLFATPFTGTASA